MPSQFPGAIEITFVCAIWRASCGPRIPAPQTCQAVLVPEWRDGCIFLALFPGIHCTSDINQPIRTNAVKTWLSGQSSYVFHRSRRSDLGLHTRRQGAPLALLISKARTKTRSALGTEAIVKRSSASTRRHIPQSEAASRGMGAARDSRPPDSLVTPSRSSSRTRQSARWHAQRRRPRVCHRTSRCSMKPTAGILN
jgi:hypothetical protein